jgi:hypothetical protein
MLTLHCFLLIEFFFLMYPCLLIQSLNRYCTFRGHHGCDHMVVGFTTTYSISSYHHWSREFESRSWRGVLDITLCDKVCQWLAAGPGLSPRTPVSSTNKIDHHNVTEILLKVALNSITLSSLAQNLPSDLKLM